MQESQAAIHQNRFRRPLKLPKEGLQLLQQHPLTIDAMLVITLVIHENEPIPLEKQIELPAPILSVSYTSKPITNRKMSVGNIVLHGYSNIKKQWYK